MTHVISGTFKICQGIYKECTYISRYYRGKVLWRKPIRVLTPNYESDVSSVQEMGFIDPKEVTKGAENSKDSAIISKPDKTVVPYEKLNKNDASFTKLVGMIKNRKRREKSGKILLEGKRLINDALKVGMQMKALYFSREDDLYDIKLKNPEGVKVCKVLYQTLKVWSSLTTCPGVMAVFDRPNAEDVSVLTQSTIPVTLLCDNIREPGNLGSIIRNAAAAGCENILLLKGCVDPWDPKVLRAACGGHFRIPIVNNIEWSQVSNYLPSNSSLFVADNSADIDMVSSSEEFINFDEAEEIEEIKYLAVNEHDQPIRVDESFDSKVELGKYKNIQLPCFLYSAVKYPQNNIVLYVGGETHGIDSRTSKLACEFNGKKVKVPMENGVESLNSAFAMTVILYEIKRQQSQLYVTK